MCILTILAHMGGWTHHSQGGYHLEFVNIDIDIFRELQLGQKWGGLQAQVWGVHAGVTQVYICHTLTRRLNKLSLHKIGTSASCFHWPQCVINEGPFLGKSAVASINVNIEELWDHYADMSLAPAICLILGSTGLSLGDSVGPWAGEYNCVGGNISADTATI